MSEELKPCLLCNGVSVGFRDHGLPETQIGCNDCGLTTRYYPNRAEAIAAWNTRPALKDRDVVLEEAARICAVMAEDFITGQSKLGERMPRNAAIAGILQSAEANIRNLKERV